jgi:hypothetical protein
MKENVVSTAEKSKPQPELTNEEFIARLMKFSDRGAMMQVFIIEGLRLYSDAVLAGKVKLLEDMANGPISGEAWVACAEEYLREERARFGR